MKALTGRYRFACGPIGDRVSCGADRPENPPRSTPSRQRAAPRPDAGPAATPRRMKSAAFSGKTGAVQRCGRVASSRHPPSCSHRHRSATRPAARDRRKIAVRDDRGAHAPPGRRRPARPATSDRARTSRSASALESRSRCASRLGVLLDTKRRARRAAAPRRPRCRLPPRPSPCSRSSQEAARRRARAPSKPVSAMTASAGVACGASRSFSNSIRTRSRDSVSSPARAPMQACKPAASGAPAPYQA